jgi:hypothetical protein
MEDFPFGWLDIAQQLRFQICSHWKRADRPDESGPFSCVVAHLHVSTLLGAQGHDFDRGTPLAGQRAILQM